RIVDAIFDELGTDVVLHAWPAAEITPAALRAFLPVSDLLVDEVSILDPFVAGLSLRADGADVTETLPHRLLFDGKTFATYLVYSGDAAAQPLHMSLILPVEGLPGGPRTVARLSQST